MDDVAIARALHVIAVIHGIGGLAFFTLVPLLHRRVEQGMWTQPQASLLNTGLIHVVLLAGAGLNGTRRGRGRPRAILAMKGLGA
ncbi:MAG: hypothetical protein B7Y12_14260 [Rhizobiales bacterium 24-66-13]|jgi:uncharacterized protein YjeT (DUF2065 family)|uniref:hypothetical protein n=1 Tax=Roseixanthobacter finlandensis TaxID=3119922 RepID=UPI000BC8A758|nr:MAG: hypothetical protein B7Y61_14115 [Rhizobiales bacterium 35-66-30]OYZ73937.1 MAG: hypothetical protein B7Y12_14260 [Rhizobiales bacterium 24-66-13]OZB03509.1 MAG: hypothetical protein B7X67_16775 [Rhizobiales bacterium 39-66-18]HQS11262.1 hypothetical protein [Xanthobacteraceae bacterium]HQS48490.1 hypothetical protein [Xanthobacteraceae bacterium]